MLQNLKTQTVTKLKSLNCDNSKSRIVTKLKIVAKLKNSNCDRTQKHIVTKLKLKLLQNSKTKIVTTQIVTKLKNLNWDKIPNLKL